MKCMKCGREFRSWKELPVFAEVWKGPDDYVITLADDADYEDAECIMFRGCPECKTDAYIVDDYTHLRLEWEKFCQYLFEDSGFAKATLRFCDRLNEIPSTAWIIRKFNKFLDWIEKKGRPNK